MLQFHVSLVSVVLIQTEFCSPLFGGFDCGVVATCKQEGMVKLVIERYTREAGVRNLERNLAALARAAAVLVAEQEHSLPLIKDINPISSPLLGSRIAEGGAEVEMEVIPMEVYN